jgi:hypothetical protein
MHEGRFEENSCVNEEVHVNSAVGTAWSLSPTSQPQLLRCERDRPHSALDTSNCLQLSINGAALRDSYPQIREQCMPWPSSASDEQPRSWLLPELACRLHLEMLR